MVHITLNEEIQHMKSSIVNIRGLELSLYEYLHAQKQTQSADIFEFPEYNIAFMGYSGEKAEAEKLDALFVKKQMKGIGYSLNIYSFIGVHLAAGNYRYELLEKKFNESDLKTQFIISEVFFTLKEKFIQILDLEDAKSDFYYRILDMIYKNKYTLDEKRIIIQEYLSGLTSFDIIDLYILESVQKFNLGVGFCEYSAAETVIHILNNFSNAIKRITNDRYNSRLGLQIFDEYDVQDILFALLKGFFDDLEREDPVTKLAGKSSRIDLNIRSQGIMIEVKMIKDKDKDHKKFVDELKIDIINYSAWDDLRDLILFIYDPYNKTTDKNHFKELEGIKENNSIRFMVHSVLVN